MSTYKREPYVEITLSTSLKLENLTWHRKIEQWGKHLRHSPHITCLPPQKHPIISLKIIDTPEAITLNQQYRNKDYASNVLAFPMYPSLRIHPLFCGIEPHLFILGDIAICWPKVQQEAKTMGISEEAHFAHLFIHAILHLLGYDHKTKENADEMESIETKLLVELGYIDPYS